MLLEVVGFDWNCPAYITPRFTEAEIREASALLHARIASLEADLARLTVASLNPRAGSLDRER